MGESQAKLIIWSARPHIRPFASFTQQSQASRPKAPDAGVSSGSSGSAAAAVPDKPAHDVVAGAMARAASQSTIHPLDTMKVRMQAGSMPGKSSQPAAAAAASSGSSAKVGNSSTSLSLQRGLTEVASLYKGVVSAASGAGIIIGAYFAFYSTSKRFLRRKTEWKEGQIAFVSGAAAAVGSGVVKVPIAVCIRSVQAGVYPNVVQAARSITQAAGARGLFTGFLPTLLEDVPDMAVKFAVYETMRLTHRSLASERQPSTLEDLFMGGFAGAAAAAATTPLDVVKTRMMCTASSRPTLLGAARSVLAEGEGLKAFFRGVGPRALSNGLNSAVFFCFFEAIRRVLVARQQQAAEQEAVQLRLGQEPLLLPEHKQQHRSLDQQQQQHRQQPVLALASTGDSSGSSIHIGSSIRQPRSGGGGRLACLSLALPVTPAAQWW
ncbi:mitochondrial carrier [Scenedesmus sp. NREL 46B-D3]|nr:mitochondrial carrier [Scenedesmus sp. NREL 46B-D3]